MRKCPKRGSALGIWAAALGAMLAGTGLWATERTRIHLALEDSIRSFDPRQSVDARSLSLDDLLHCRLMTYDAQGQLVPGIAAADPQWKTPRILHVALKDGIKFSDGTTVSAHDVAATYEALLRDKTLARRASFPQLLAVEAQGNTLTFTLKEADAAFTGKLVLGILPAKLARTARLDPLQTPVCGPYQMKSRQNSEILLEENPQHTPRPRLKQILLRIVRSEKTRLSQLQAGDLDLVQGGINPLALKDITRKHPQLELLRSPALRTSYLGFNLRDKILGQAAVREAIAAAINRQEIIDLVLGGMATAASSLLPPASPFAHKSLHERPRDPAKAEKWLDEAGFPRKGSYRFELSYKVTHSITQISIAKALAAQLNKIGIKVVVEPMDAASLEDDLANGRVQLWSHSWEDIKDPDIYREAFGTNSLPPLGHNRGWYSNPRLDALLEQGKINSSTEQRIRIYHEAQEIVNRDLPYIFLWHEDHFAVVKRFLKGFQPYPDGRYASLIQAYLDP